MVNSSPQLEVGQTNVAAETTPQDSRVRWRGIVVRDATKLLQQSRVEEGEAHSAVSCSERRGRSESRIVSTGHCGATARLPTASEQPAVLSEGGGHSGEAYVCYCFR